MDEEFLAELRQCFFEDSLESFEKTEACFIDLEKQNNIEENLDEISRVFHNIKGGAKSIGFNELGDFCHITEDLIVAIKKNELPLNSSNIDCLLKSNDLLKESLSLLENNQLPKNYFKQHENKINSIINKENTSGVGELKVVPEDTAQIQEQIQPLEKPAEKNININNTKVINELKVKPNLKTAPRPNLGNQSIKMPLNKIDNLINLFGEQSINLSRLNNLSKDINKDSIKEFRGALDSLNKLTHDLQQTVLSLRMIKVDKLFSRLERVVRETAKQVNKKIVFHTNGKDSELDKTIVDALLDPLTHMVRNAVDHGIESDSTSRIFSGKDEIGNITLSAMRRGGNFVIELTDDGKGMDKDKLVAKAVEKGIINSKDEIKENDIFSLIFKKGFSSAEQLTDVSGRGVGMDVVNQMISKLRGHCEINSVVGEGSVFTITLPLSLAMINGTLVRANQQNYVIPNSDFCQTAQIQGYMIKESNINDYCLEYSGSVYPLLPLHNILSSDYNKKFEDNNYVALFVDYKKDKFAILLDDLVSQEKIILKKVDEEIESINGILGGAILGDGNVVLVLEVKEIIENYLMVS